MGIKLLSSLLSKYCQSAITKHSLQNFRGKRFVIDASNCIYRFLPNDTLIPCIYEFCVTLKYYGIQPLFIFDGPNMIHKKDVIMERRREREEARRMYETLIQEPNPDQNAIKNAKLKMIKMTSKNIADVKELLVSLKMPYIEAKSEADEVCARMVIDGYAHACVSGDTDMFIYGCPRVIRYLSIRKHTCIEFNLNHILDSLSLTFDEFKKVCMVAGTDYNNMNINMYAAYELWTQYKLEATDYCFYDWLIFKGILDTKDKIIQGSDIYNTQNKLEYSFVENYNDDKQLNTILQKHNFINL